MTQKKTNKKSAASPISPLAPEQFPDMPEVAGVTLGTAKAGIKYKNRSDVFVARFAKGTQGAGVLTQSRIVGAPIDWCRHVIDPDHGMPSARALVVNAGNANVFTGPVGRETVKASVAAVAKAAGCRQKDVAVAATGVIGEVMTAKNIEKGIAKACAKQKSEPWEKAARAIMTTDTFPKGSFREAVIDGQTVKICGIAKGSGMIAPDMATMLSFVFTDAALPSPILQTLLSVNVRDTFNAITVDSDTSTSDTLMLFATGHAQHGPITRAGDRRLLDFRNKLSEVLLDLAHQVVRDGEGASKFIAVTVKGAQNARAAKKIALSIGNSPLVKTAIAGEDANWGRIAMAVGKAGEHVDPKKLRILMGGVCLSKGGAVNPDYREKDVMPYLKGQDIDIVVDVSVGNGEATIWTCDLTHGYISINADYRS